MTEYSGILVEVQRGNRARLPELWSGVRSFAARQANRRIAAYREHNTDCAVDAEDLLQEGFLALLEAIESFQGGGRMSFLGWWELYLKTAYNEALGVRTKRALHEPVHQCARLSQPMGDMDGAMLGDLVPADNGDFGRVEDNIWRQQLHSAMTEALAELTEAQRDILRERYYEGRSRLQLAQAAGISREAIRTREARALETMRKTVAAGRLAEFAGQL